MKNFKSVLAMTLVLVSANLLASSDHEGRKHGAKNIFVDFGKVIDATPIYRQVRVSNPVRECWDEPVIYTRNEYSQPKSASGMAVGGILGGIIGHQIGKGRGKKLATVMGTIIGAQIGHAAVNGHVTSNRSSSYTVYEERCDVRHQVSYEEVLHGYRVTYRYQGEQYELEMPYHPGKRIKLRIQIIPVI
ncbi:MAG: glycine zipper 2TM domain-containing protein [Proteobacteria bacterium]|nr:glycine zipper 2TM domain-containing protein [Pseudomonadota bacterium]MCH8177973.1 glycine zipper 2TM domain-containing protein [Pseudomonadota bacterium]